MYNAYRCDTRVRFLAVEEGLQVIFTLHIPIKRALDLSVNNLNESLDNLICQIQEG